MAKIIDGKKISAEIKEELKTEVAAYAAQGKKCALAVIQTIQMFMEFCASFHSRNISAKTM